MESMATNLKLKLWNRWNSASSIHVQQTKPRKLNPAFNSESADDGANSWCHYMLLKRVHFFSLLLLFFFLIHSMDTKPIFYFFTPYRNCAHACKVASVLSCCLQPMECSTPGSYVHGILQAKILEWVAIPSFRGSSQPRNWTSVSYVLSRQSGSLLLAPPAKPILFIISIYQDYQFSAVTQSCLTLCYPMDCSMPGFPDHH